MSGLEADTVGGFNSMIAKQQHEAGEALVSTVLFDNCSEVIHDRVNIRDIKLMTQSDYTVGAVPLCWTLSAALFTISAMCISTHVPRMCRSARSL